ncbi:MAG: peptidase M64 [Bacteroidetes bacterium HGW-Bacteroidetes-21]|jgi:hypothetical protein|nr:MAG: peptidase M64 [Bacteroidetes bacterium HGW-Bacteroidetes-21]
MKKVFFVISILLSLDSFATYDDFFSSASLRVEYTIAGNKTSQEIFLHALKKGEFWAGPRKNMTDTFNYGHYRVMVYDSLSNKMLYLKGFSSLFREWQDTPEAEVMKRSWNEVLIIPYPLKTIKLVIERRDKANIFQPLFSCFINPAKDKISEDKSLLTSFEIQKKGNPSEKVDLVFIPDGYTQAEMKKFREDANRFAGYLFQTHPFIDNKENFNVYGVELPSPESGTDIPGDNVWKNTALNSSFYTFEMERYLNVFDMWALYDAISGLPSDQVFVIVNSSKYGGSGIFNYYAICSSDNPASEYVVVHEFGHAFGGLGDEYYDKSVTWSDYYPLNVEPWEPNLTTLIAFDKKWKNMLVNGVAVPTPSSLTNAATLGVYEGGGYSAKGVYRPMMDCTMKTNKPDNFCPVCRAAIQRMIDFYCGK